MFGECHVPLHVKDLFSRHIVAATEDCIFRHYPILHTFIFFVTTQFSILLYLSSLPNSPYFYIFRHYPILHTFIFFVSTQFSILLYFSSLPNSPYFYIFRNYPILYTFIFFVTTHFSILLYFSSLPNSPYFFSGSRKSLAPLTHPFHHFYIVLYIYY
jgi:hypothetical protein